MVSGMENSHLFKSHPPPTPHDSPQHAALTRSHPPKSNVSQLAPRAPPTAPPAYFNNPQSLQEKINQLADELDLSDEIVEDLLRWYGTEVVVIADDSGSMTAIADYKSATTRWQELQQRLSDLLQLLLVIDLDAEIQLLFLNSVPNGSAQGYAVSIRTHEDLQRC